MRNALTGYSMAEDGEIFLSLEDTSAPKVEVKKRKPRTIISKNLKPLTDSYIEDKNNTMDMVVLSEYGGKQSICWPIQDMDCPHCAAEAMNALNRLGHVNSSLVSATEGTVTVEAST